MSDAKLAEALRNCIGRAGCGCTHPLCEDCATVPQEAKDLIAAHDASQRSDGENYRKLKAQLLATEADFHGVLHRFCEHHRVPGAVGPGCPECAREEKRSDGWIRVEERLPEEVETLREIVAESVREAKESAEHFAIYGDAHGDVKRWNKWKARLKAREAVKAWLESKLPPAPTGGMWG